MEKNELTKAGQNLLEGIVRNDSIEVATQGGCLYRTGNPGNREDGRKGKEGEGTAVVAYATLYRTINRLVVC